MVDGGYSWYLVDFILYSIAIYQQNIVLKNLIKFVEDPFPVMNDIKATNYLKIFI